MKVTCRKCEHQFEIEIPLPAPVDDFCARLEAAHCPVCGSGIKSLAMGWAEETPVPSGTVK